MKKKPTLKHALPGAGRRILGWIISRDLRDAALEDFEEEFAAVAAEKGIAAAHLCFWWQVVKSVPHFMADSIWWCAVMFKSHMTVAWRGLKKNKAFALINVFGLSVGMACCIVIMLFIQFELSFDRYHENAERIHRVVRKRVARGREEYSTITPWILRTVLISNIPEVEGAARLEFHRSFVIRYGEKSVKSDILYADPSLLNIFTLPLMRGDRTIVLRDPTSVVLSENFAKKLFGREDPVGKTITTYYEGKPYDFQVSGILKNVPKNSHFRIDVLVPLEHLFKRHSKELYRLNSVSTYLLIKKNSDPKALKAKLEALAAKLMGKSGAGPSYFLQPLTSIYFHSAGYGGGDEKGRLSTSYFLSVTALIILLIACVNFVNLSTARAARRSREVGLRRVTGAGRGQLFAQFLGESFFLSFVALALALLLTFLFLPVFNALMNRDLSMRLAGNPNLFAGLMALTLAVGLLSGVYPAFVLSSFRPVEALKGEARKGTRFGVFMRKGLVVFQFAISLVFIIGTVAVARQLHYVKTKDLGFKKDNIVGISIMRDDRLRQRPEMIKEKLGRLPGVTDIAVTSGAPGFDSGSPVPVEPEGYAEGQSMELYLSQDAEDIFRFFAIRLVEGRYFSKEIVSDEASAVILNEKAVKALGWSQPLGKKISCGWVEESFNKKGPFTVIGVLKDFHNGSLHEEIKPTMYMFDPGRRFQVFMNVRPDRLREFLSALRTAWPEMNSILPFDYYFLDDWLDRYLYQEDRRVSKVFAVSSVLAVILACLGLLGLASYAAESRKKEIGIRKVLGATVTGIVAMFSREFSVLVVVGSILAWPAGYCVIRRWLQDFAYRIGISPWIFLLASGLVLLLTLITVGLQSCRAALINPADTLRHE